MSGKKIVSPFVLLCVAVVLMGAISLALASPGITYTVTLESDKTETYPSQEFRLTAFYVSSYPESERGNHVFADEFPEVVVDAGGLVEDISTSCLLPAGAIDEAGVKYDFAEATIKVPLETYEKNHEGTYDIFLNSPVKSNSLKLKVLVVNEKATIELEKGEANPGDEIKFTIKYILLSPGVVLERPLNDVELDTNIPEEYLSGGKQPSISFPGKVESGEEITIVSGTIRIPEEAEKENYNIKAVVGPPKIETNVVELSVQETSSSATPSSLPSDSSSPTTSSPSTSSPLGKGDVSPISLSGLSNNIIQGAITGVVGFGLAEVLNHLLGGGSKVEKTPEIEPVQGSSEGEEMVLLRSRDETSHARLQRYLDSQARSTSPLARYHRYDSGWIEYKRLTQGEAKVIDDKFEAERNRKGQDLGDEYDELMENKPKWLDRYQKERWKKTRWREPDVVWESQFQENFKKSLSPKDIEDYRKWYEHYKSFQRRNFYERIKSFGNRFAAVAGSLG